MNLHLRETVNIQRRPLHLRRPVNQIIFESLVRPISHLHATTD